MMKTSPLFLALPAVLCLIACSSEDSASDENMNPGTGGAASGGQGTGGGTASGGGTGSGGAAAGGSAAGGSSSGGAPAGGAPGSSGGATSGGAPGTGGMPGTGGGPTAAVEDSGLDCTVGESSGPNGASGTTLPDPLTSWDGSQVQSMEDWRCRRRELVVEVEKLILGEKAPPPHTIGGSVDGSVSESSYSVEVTTPGGSASFGGSVSLPSSGSAPYPAVIYLAMPPFFSGHSLNSDVLNSEGVATMSYPVTDVASEASGNFTSGQYYQANPDYAGNTSALVAWAWGVSRIIDMLEKHPDVIDPTKIAVHGCSRLGKGAFVIGAFDERIALGLPLEPGTGGPAPLRALPSLGGQSLSSANGEASWFGPMSGSYNANMPVDMSDVVAMYAPRGLLMMDNPHIDHLSYKANYLGVAAGRKVYEAMGAEDAAWYLGSSNDGGHCNVRPEYADALRAMIQKYLKGGGTGETGGLDTHSNHGNVDVNGWTSNFSETTF